MGSLCLWSEEMSPSGPCGAPFPMVMTVAHYCEPRSAHHSQVQHTQKSPTEGLLARFTAFFSPHVGVLVLRVVGIGSSGKTVWAVEPKEAVIEVFCLQRSRYVQFRRDPRPQPCVRTAIVWADHRLSYYTWRLREQESCLFSLTQASNYIRMSPGGLE